ncbi:MAG: polysaccharide export protein [Alphaproteobacteria bacterium]|nr:polysaccharide export protein [Alphaproteobacteria bacterium]
MSQGKQLRSVHPSRRRVFVALASLCAIGASGCAVPNQPRETQPPGPPPTLRIGPGDRVQVTVFGVNEMTGEYLVSDSGTISLPLAGQVPMGSMTTRQAEEALTQRLAQGLVQNPQVSINVTRYRQIFVVGEVQRPGGFDYFSGLTVLNAVALGGGYSVRADPRRLTVVRAADPARRAEPATEATYLAPGDTLQVPERWF